MSLIPLKPILDYAQKNKLAHGAFNVNMMVQAEAIVEIHTAFRSAAIIQGAEPSNAFIGGNINFLNGTLEEKKLGAKRIADKVKELSLTTNIPIVLHLDHGKSLEIVKATIEAGYTSVMIDGSALSFSDNLDLTREVVKYAHKRGVSVEGELGILAGVEDDVTSESSTYTNPMKVVEFFKKTGCDFLALSYGTMHGPIKGKNVKLRKEIIIAAMENMLHEHIDGALVSHGSSTVPEYIVSEVNALGGKITNASGISEFELSAAISSGISKINIDTDIRLAVTRNIWEMFEHHPELKTHFDQIWKIMQKNPGEIDPRVYMVPVLPLMLEKDHQPSEQEKRLLVVIKLAVMEAVGSLIIKFGALGDAPNIEQKSLEQMADFYRQRGF